MDHEDAIAQFKTELPSETHDRFDAITRLVLRFCGETLTHRQVEYTAFGFMMVAALLIDREDPKKPGIALDRAKPESWAAGVMWTLMQNNAPLEWGGDDWFYAEEMAECFGVSQGTMQSKASRIRRSLNLMPMDPAWTLPTLALGNPMIWIRQTDEGLLVDLRRAPRAVQEEAYEAGVIPFIPDDLYELEDEQDEAGLEDEDDDEGFHHHDPFGDDDDDPPAVIGRIFHDN